ncbi:serine/threonine-protein kinase [Nonomuraea mesophila]|uniref:serine/threonine-protein kinase n=1 Tax=Nonomuraea mesophila TaxID=2530382 RepID=UPI001C7071D4|nr:serine/threonine-protein kinase [Nonomuraea mesophila]
MAHVEPLREDDPAVVGTYHLLGRLGSGGQGTVYLGQAPDGTRVAVKVLHSRAGFDDRFAKEIDNARRVEPFCIAQVLDASLGRQPYIVTEYVEGPSLHEAGRHAGADLQRLAVATATALAAIHAAGIVHRDFKPANVLLGPGGPRVIDFGIARAMDDAATHTSGIVGTPAYMAPEQLAGQPVGPPADVFAWASVMVWAATGTPPFGQDTLPAIINRILNNEPQLGDLPHPLRSIVYDCLAKDPRARPTMRDVLLRLLSGNNPAPHASGNSPQVPHAGWENARMPHAGGPGPMPPHARPGTGPMSPHGTHAGGRRGLVPVVAGVSGVVVAALIGGIVWIAPGWGAPEKESLAASSPSATSPTVKPSSGQTPTPAGKKTSKRKKPSTRTAKPTATPKKPTPKATASPKRTTARPTPARSRTRTATSKKPATNAKASILAIELMGGPGQSSGGCYMPPVHFQTRVESTRRGVWISYAWLVDGRTKESGRSWVPEDDHTAFVTAKQYNLPAGRHTVALKVTSPSSAQKSISFSVCALETW